MAARSVQPVARSTAHRVSRKCPAALGPQCATRSPAADGCGDRAQQPFEGRDADPLEFGTHLSPKGVDRGYHLR